MSYKLRISIVIITANRKNELVDCIKNIHLLYRNVDEYEIIVVDASAPPIHDLQSHFKNRLTYIQSNIMNMPYQRNIGWQVAKSDIVAFLDDDSMILPGWMEAIVSEYTDPSVGCVGGLVIQDGVLVSDESPSMIGKILPDGRFSANFGNEINVSISVDHVMGCNMSFRKDILTKTGGFDTNFKGTCFAEETDLCTSVRESGYRVIFSPFARVKHLVSPRSGHSRERSNLKFQYFHSKNKAYFLSKHYGLSKSLFNFLFLDFYDTLIVFSKRALYQIAIIFANIFGKVIGCTIAISYLFKRHLKF